MKGLSLELKGRDNETQRQFLSSPHFYVQF
jgi:hypothetical protein